MRTVPGVALLVLATAAFVTSAGCSPDTDGIAPGGADDANGPGAGGGDDDGPGGDDDGAPAGIVGAVEILAEFGDVVVGGPTPMRALVRDKAGDVLGGQPLVWSSDNVAVATVDAATGIVTGVSAGTTAVRVVSGGASASVNVTVEAAVAEPNVVGAPRGSLLDQGILTRAGKFYHRTLRALVGERPVYQPGPVRFRQIAMLRDVFVALGVDGQLYSWVVPSNTVGPIAALYGMNYPRGTFVAHTLPTLIPTTVRFKALVAGGSSYDTATALAEDGTLYRWGSSIHFIDSGSFGSEDQVAKPQPIYASVKFKAIAQNGIFMTGVAIDGRSFRWRADHCAQGEVGQNGATCAASPYEEFNLTQLAPGSNVALTTVSTNGSGTYFGIAADGTGYSWGSRATGVAPPRDMLMHGRGTDAAPSAVPLPLSTTDKVSAISVPGSHALAIRADGRLLQWGAVKATGPSTAEDVYLPTLVPGLADKRFSSIHSDGNPAYGVTWVGFEVDGHAVVIPSAGASSTMPSFDGLPTYVGRDRTIVETYAAGQGSRVVIPLQPFDAATGLTANGLSMPAKSIAPHLKSRDSSKRDQGGKLEDDGLTLELVPPVIEPGQAATALVVTVAPSATPGPRTFLVFQEENELGTTQFGVEVTPPPPPPGTPLDLVCSSPTTPLPQGYWCLTNSGGATAPHNWVDLTALPNTTWQYENLCISYKSGGRYAARFRGPSGTVTPRSGKFGVLARKSGDPEVTGTGHWLLYHEGIGDPQVEQLTFNPQNKKVGESWGFASGGCSF